MKRYIIVIWHQAGGRNDAPTYYTWNEEDDAARVFNSPEKAKAAWKEAEMHRVHSGVIVDVTESHNAWI